MAKVKNGSGKRSAKGIEKLNENKKSKAAKTSVILIKNIEELKRVYDLPDENINAMMIIHKMAETLEFYLKLIQQILQPEEFHSVYECNSFDDIDKAKLFDLYKRIIIAHRELLKATIVAEDKNSLSTIQFVHEEAKSVKPQMLDIIAKMQQSWKDTGKDTQKGPKQYFG